MICTFDIVERTARSKKSSGTAKWLVQSGPCNYEDVRSIRSGRTLGDRRPRKKKRVLRFGPAAKDIPIYLRCLKYASGRYYLEEMKYREGELCGKRLDSVGPALARGVILLLPASMNFGRYKFQRSQNWKSQHGHWLTGTKGYALAIEIYLVP